MEDEFDPRSAQAGRSYPEPTASPCNECPWRRRAAPGWLGPYDAITWIAYVIGEGAIACHKTITADEMGSGDWDDPGIRQCRGAAIFRQNVGKLPMNGAIATGPTDHEAVFSSPSEFVDYHERRR